MPMLGVGEQALPGREASGLLQFRSLKRAAFLVRGCVLYWCCCAPGLHLRVRKCRDLEPGAYAGATVASSVQNISACFRWFLCEAVRDSACGFLEVSSLS